METAFILFSYSKFGNVNEQGCADFGEWTLDEA